ncbi:MAG TPA: hypothetical protein VET24_16865 [Actinomycetota bacterium]|nr:hypothetical protein [Actinomycetota bacterium]
MSLVRSGNAQPGPAEPPTDISRAYAFATERSIFEVADDVLARRLTLTRETPA